MEHTIGRGAPPDQGPDAAPVLNDTENTAPDANDTENTAPDTSNTENATPGANDTENTAPDADDTGPATPVRTAFKPLFFAALALTAALAAVCGALCFQSRAAAAQAEELDRQAALLALEIEELRDLARRNQEELDRQAQELAQAQDTIDFLEEYSIAAPDGALPEYTQLYPDFYAPAWEGEAVDGGRVCCLTFDDGPSANTDRVLEILDRCNIKATFFVVGRTGAADRERMRKIVAAGHTIAMHSWSHNYRTVYASVESFLDEFNSLYQYIHEVTGVYPQVYRFPGGSINGYDRGIYQEIIAEMTRRGFVYFDWNASAQDATSHPRPAADIAADCLKGVGRDLVVVLSHDSAARGTTVDALPAVIEGYQAAGYTFAALNPGVRPITFGYPAVR